MIEDEQVNEQTMEEAPMPRQVSWSHYIGALATVLTAVFISWQTGHDDQIATRAQVVSLAAELSKFEQKLEPVLEAESGKDTRITQTEQAVKEIRYSIDQLRSRK